MNAEEFGAFVFLHELSHIMDAGNAHVGTIDTDPYNRSIVSKCIR
jgi:hypothetical protein